MASCTVSSTVLLLVREPMCLLVDHAPCTICTVHAHTSMNNKFCHVKQSPIPISTCTCSPFIIVYWYQVESTCTVFALWFENWTKIAKSSGLTLDKNENATVVQSSTTRVRQYCNTWYCSRVFASLIQWPAHVWLTEQCSPYRLPSHQSPNEHSK